MLARAEKAERERDEARGSLEKQREYTKLAMGERDTLRADVERWVKEVAHLKLAAEKAERERMREELTFE